MFMSLKEIYKIYASEHSLALPLTVTQMQNALVEWVYKSVQGYAPFIGENGNWFVYDRETDTMKDSGEKAGVHIEDIFNLLEAQHITITLSEDNTRIKFDLSEPVIAKLNDAHTTAHSAQTEAIEARGTAINALDTANQALNGLAEKMAKMIVITSNEQETVEGVQVPKLATEQMTSIHNAFIENKVVKIVSTTLHSDYIVLEEHDLTGDMLTCRILLNDTHIVTYQLTGSGSEEHVAVTVKAIGGGGDKVLYKHNIEIFGGTYGLYISFSIINERQERYENTTQIARYLYTLSSTNTPTISASGSIKPMNKFCNVFCIQSVELEEDYILCSVGFIDETNEMDNYQYIEEDVMDIVERL